MSKTKKSKKLKIERKEKLNKNIETHNAIARFLFALDRIYNDFYIFIIFLRIFDIFCQLYFVIIFWILSLLYLILIYRRSEKFISLVKLIINIRKIIHETLKLSYLILIITFNTIYIKRIYINIFIKLQLFYQILFILSLILNIIFMIKILRIMYYYLKVLFFAQSLRFKLLISYLVSELFFLIFIFLIFNTAVSVLVLKTYNYFYVSILLLIYIFITLLIPFLVIKKLTINFSVNVLILIEYSFKVYCFFSINCLLFYEFVCNKYDKNIQSFFLYDWIIFSEK
ncbi:hypothetical protein TUBRATIS_13170 [Tubulinosema ratisbonensis]|uniref:Uncharacterized protein n=1 Tax=Tubulinosema ratisbonensis TaxID=291195 RepID=A0A437AM67_9MICR|nr:hypothetical protein TUBRATIS_13170 [Tubulinosema ratisbonensis]